jgi:CubicO group peptidase (beta-lactamase class C family)
MKPRIAACFVLLSLPVLGWAAPARDATMPERYNVGGYIKASRTAPHVFTPHADPRPLPAATADMMAGRGNGEAATAARAYMRQFPATTGMLLIDWGRVVFEAYRGLGNADSEFYSMSIAKSMTSLAVGTALCAGKIPGLDTPAGDLVPELRINNFGRSTVRQLLLMSSGAYKPSFVGQPDFAGALGSSSVTGKPYRSTSWPLRLGRITVADVLWGRLWPHVRHQAVNAPGDRFLYKGGDTMALSTVVERTAGMSLAAWFEQTVWREVRGGKPGHWESDRDGTTVGFSGFQVSLRDWGRIALWVLEHRGEPGCLGDYIRAATSRQIAIPPDGKTAGGYRGYGYQYWVDNPYVPGYWAKGFAGQEIATDPDSGKILIKFGYRNGDGSGGALFRLFRDWTAVGE